MSRAADRKRQIASHIEDYYEKHGEVPTYAQFLDHVDGKAATAASVPIAPDTLVLADFATYRGDA